MGKYVLFFLLCICTGNILAQDCPDFSFTIDSQEEMDEFFMLFPNCTNITRDIRLGASSGGSTLTDLSQMSQIVSVAGDLLVSNNPLITSLVGLQNIKSVGVDLEIYDNDLLTDMTAINQIETIGEDFDIRNNASLTSLGIFSALEIIPENLDIEETPITSIDAFPALTFVDDLTIQETDLIDLAGLSSLVTVAGTLNISDNLMMQTISGFGGLTTIENLRIYENPALLNIGGFQSLDYVSKTLSVNTNESLISFTGSFTALDSISGPFILEENLVLSSLPQMDQLTKTSDLIFRNNGMLANLSGLESLTDLAGEIQFRDNAGLVSLNGLESIDPFKVTKLTLLNNPNLSTCDIPSICELIKREIIKVISGNDGGCSSFIDLYYNSCRNHECYTGGFTITSQEQIDNFDTEYPYCTFINGDLEIGDITGMLGSTVTDISGLAQIDSVWGSISVMNNPILEILEGFEDLEYIHEDLNVASNPALIEIDAVDKVRSYNGSILIKDNPVLVKKWQPYSVNVVNGDIEFSNNPMLSENSSFINLTNIGGSFIFDNNDASTSTFRMEDLEVVGGDFIYRNNAQAHQPINTRKLRIVGGDVIITNNESFGTFNFWGQDTIIGDFICTNNPSLTTFRPIGLRAVLGDLVLSDNSKMISISSNENTFTHLGGDLIIKNNEMLGRNFGGFVGLIGFIELSSLSGKLEIIGNPELTTLGGLERIVHDGVTSLTITDNTKLADCDIQAVCGAIAANVIDINISSNGESCNSREEVSEECDLSYCWTGDVTLRNQEDVDRFISSNPNCTIINGDLDIERNDPKDISGLSNLTKVEGTLTISVGSGGLSSLEGLHNIEQVGSLNIHTTTLENLSGLENLKRIEGEFRIRESSLQSLDGLSSLERVGSIAAFVPVYLPSFKGLESLRRIDGGLTMQSAGGLQSLDGLENVSEFAGRISIFACDELIDIAGINNFPVDSITTISISSNDLLQNCTSKLLCRYLNLNPNANVITLGNGPGCTSDDDLDCKQYSLTGQVYFDSNENGQKDSNEFGINGIQVNVESTPGIPLTNQDGAYFQYADSGQVYTISLVPDSDWQLTSPDASYEVTFDPSVTASYDFGLKSTFDRHTSTVSLTAENNRCNEEGILHMQLQNTGNYEESGEVVIKLDPLLEYIESNPEATSYDEITNTLVWEYDELHPYEKMQVEIDVNMPDENSTGAILSNIVEHYALVSGELELITTITDEVLVRCSYDPNDKQVSPVGLGDQRYVLKDEPLTYTIRFQNTGNDYAKNVRLVDTIAPQFDIRSLEVLNSSHEVYTLVEGRTVSFIFDNIYLVDSLTNEPASHGFVSFKMNLLEDIPDFSVLENFADIFFDFNPPIRTNTVENIAVEMFPTATKEEEANKAIMVRPNPAQDEITVMTSVGGVIDIYDAQMNRVISALPVTSDRSLRLDLSQWLPGVYFMSLRSSDGSVATKSIMKL